MTKMDEMTEAFLLKSIAEDGSVLWSREVKGIEILPFEGDSVNGKGRIQVVDKDAFTMHLSSEHDHFEWETKPPQFEGTSTREGKPPGAY